MKKIKIILIAIFVFGILIPNVNAQESKDQLWYCWEETVKPEKIDQYLELSKEFLELCKTEKFPFGIATWQAKPFIYELWSPISSLSDIEKMDKAWENIILKLGTEKYQAFQNTKLYNKRFTCTIRNEISYTPKNPDYKRNEFSFSSWIELYIKEGKQKEFEEAVKEFNKEREKIDFGSWVFYATGEFGYESPCYIVLIGNKTREDYLKADVEIKEKLKAELQEYMEKIRPLMRKPNKYFDWYYIPELSYSPVNN